LADRARGAGRRS